MNEKQIEPDSLRQRIAKGASWVAIEMVGVQATLFAIFVQMSHFVGPREFGLINISFLAVQTSQMLILYNVDTVVARKQNAADIEYTTAFWLIIGFSTAAFGALFAFADLAERLFRAPGLAPIFRAMSIIILFMGLGRVHETWMLRHFRFKSLAMRGLAGAGASAVVGLIMAVQGFGVWALMGQQVTNSLVSTVLLWITCPWRPSFHFSQTTAKEIFRFLRTVVPNSLAYAANQNCDTFLIALFFGPVSAGIYNVGKRLRLMLQLVIGVPINNIAMPALAEIQNEPERLRRGLTSLLTLACIICSPVFLGVASVSDEVIAVIFGQKWAAAAPVLALLSCSGLAITLLQYSDTILTLKNKQIISLYLSLIYSVTALLAFVVCVHTGAKSLAFPFVIPYVLVFPLSIVLVSGLIGLSMREWLRALAPGLVSACLMFIVVKTVGNYLTEFRNIERLFIMCAGGATMYAALLWAFWHTEAVMVVNALVRVFRR